MKDIKVDYRHDAGECLGVLVTNLGTPDEATIAFNAGYSLCEVGEAARGIPFYRRALELQPGWERAAREYANVLDSAGLD